MDAAVAQLRRRGERVTPARIAVLEVLDNPGRHLTAEEIVALASARAPGVHRATIYRALSKLADLDLVTHTHLGGSAAVHHLAVLDSEPDTRSAPHAHLQCTVCGRVIDVPVATLQPLVGRLHRELDFTFEPEHTALLGTCSSCRASRSDRT